MRNFIFTILASFYLCIGFAQVAVKDEPRHHNVFENDFVRVLDVFIPPGDTTQFHVHATPSLFIPFTIAKTASQIMGAQLLPGSNSLPGAAWYDSLVVPRIHRVWNEDSTWFHVMDIELTGGEPRSNLQPIVNPGFQLLYNKPLANIYKLTLQAGMNVQFPESPGGYLLISTGDAVIDCHINAIIQHRIMKAGHYIWIQSNGVSFLTAQDNLPATLLLLQLK
ncbi:hypothetical protein BH10BAC3_BH10BAC3_28340 [soil metagenome]